MSIDLGGIGKGHALDCCARILRAHDITTAFVHGGTSSGLALGADPAGHPWRVGGALPLSLTDCAFSVSDAAGQPQPHIVDPRSGLPTAARSVVVTGPSARLCDAWSTALVVLGRAPAHFPIGYAHAETAAG
jgi:thiamine biosynthesis lipoprotein